MDVEGTSHTIIKNLVGLVRSEFGFTLTYIVEVIQVVLNLQESSGVGSNKITDWLGYIQEIEMRTSSNTMVSRTRFYDIKSKLFTLAYYNIKFG